MPLRSNSTSSSWSPLLLHSAAACCSSAADVPHPSRPLAASDDHVHGDAASISCNHHGSSHSAAASGLQTGLSIQSLPSLRSLQISYVDLPGPPSPPCSSSSSGARHRLLSSLASHPRRSASTSLAVSPAGKLLYSASHSGVAVYDLGSFRLLEAFRSVAAGAVKALAFSPDGRVFTGHQDSKIRVWSAPPPVTDASTTTVEEVEASSSHQYAAGRHRHLASLPTASDRLRRFALPGNYVTVRRHRKRLWIEHADAVAGLAVGCGLLYSVSWDKTLKVWRASDLRCLQSVPAHDDAVNAVAVARDGTVYTGSADRRIRVWQQTPPEPDNTRGRRYALVATLERHRSAVNALALSADGGVLCSGACDRSILVWERAETADGHMGVVGAIRGHRRAIMCLAIVEDLLVSGSTDRTVRVWRRTPGGEYRCLAVMEGHMGGVRSVAAHRVGASESGSPESEEAEEEYRVCSGSSDGEVRVWQVWVSSSNDKGEISMESSCS